MATAIATITAAGIQIGNPYADVYNAFIKATVWLADSNGYAAGTGMVVNGELKLSLVNLEVEEPRLNGVLQDGKGVVVNQNAYANDNQSFLLATGSIKAANVRVNNGGTVDPAPGAPDYNYVYIPHSWDSA